MSPLLCSGFEGLQVVLLTLLENILYLPITYAKLKPMFSFRIGFLFLLFQTVYLNKTTIIVDAPSDGKWSASKAKGCGDTEFDGPIVFVGNFTTYGLTLHDFHEKSRVTVHLNDSVSFYKLKNVRTPLKSFELNYDNFLMNNSFIWSSYREYRNTFQRGLDLNNKETTVNVEGEAVYIIIIQTLTLKRDGSMKFLNYVLASSDQLTENTTESSESDTGSSESDTVSSENENDTSEYETESSENETSSEYETESSRNETESLNYFRFFNFPESFRQQFMTQYDNDCAEVYVQVTSIDINI
ncbi:uncharacterized protein LOC113225716 [Hyposmocoma kahamanoa]|uniref:uncharacterized protein LOC113225716 n=1 Tax=Hyposmocoma kahamanoa TaxID=1477025 RepID=UPI000E6D7669|nr:uncharacterized protein LOC113225716 [Hyposmocoma kahamanoa]